MRSVLLVFAWFIFCGAAHAKDSKSVGDWVFIGNQGDGDSYYSKSSVDRDGDFVNVRTVINIKTGKNFTKESDGFKSYVGYFAIDCKRWLYVLTHSFRYEETFGQGKLVLGFDEKKSIAEEDIKPIDKTHLLHKLAVAVCKKH